jgi:hypothetical protein
MTLREAPRAPTVPLDRALEQEARLVVRQARHLSGLVGVEQANRYAIHDERGALAGIASERGEGAGDFLVRFSWVRRRLDLEGPGGRPLARLVGPLLHPWTFRLLAGPAGGEREVGRIEKRWSGLLTETFTAADTFLVTLPRGDPDLRKLVLAASILIDFRWFERTD